MTDYSAIAGFDTTTLAANGYFTASALTNGTAGKAIADAAANAGLPNAGTITGNGIALIRAVASDTGTSPVTSLMTFIHEVVILTNNLNVIQGITNAFWDILHTQGTTLTGATVASQATAASIAIAASGTIANAVAAGEELEISLAQVRIGGGEGGSASPYPSVASQIQAAIGSTLPVNQAIGILVGMADQYAQGVLHTLIGSDIAKATTAIAALVANVGRHDGIYAAQGFGAYDKSYNGSAATYIGQIAGWAGLSASQANAIVAGQIGTSLTAAQAVALLGQMSGGTDQILTLISNHTISAADAMAAIAGGYFNTTSAISPLLTIATSQSADLTLQMAVASALTGLIVPNGLEPNNIILAISNNSQLSASASMSMLMAVGALGNVLSSANNKYSLSQIGDVALASSLSGTDIVTAMTAGFGALGLNVDQQVTILTAVGGASKLQAPSFTWIGRADLQAAAAQQLAALIQANSAHLTADQLATDVAAAMTAANSVYWPTNIDILVRAAAGSSTMPALVGAALVKLSGLSPLSGQNGLGYVMSAIDNDNRFNNRVLTGDQTVGILLGMAAAGNASMQVAAGGELGSLVQANSFLADVYPGNNIAAALSAGTITQSQATLFLAGLAGNAKSALIKDAYQNQYVNVLTTLLSANAAGVLTTITNAVASTALSADTAVAFLAGIAGNATGQVPADAENAILALVSSSAISATQAITDLATAAGYVGVVMAIRMGGGAPGTSLYDDAVAYLGKYEGALGDTVALLVTQAQITAQDAVTAIDAAVTAGKLAGTDALRILVSAAAGNADIAALAPAEIAALITNSASNGLTTGAAVTALQGMLIGASTALANAINGELSILLADPSGLDQTAGTGTSAQIAQQAVLLGGMLNNGVQADIDTANTILSHFANRITTAHTLTAAGALTFLLDLAGQGGAALTAATATLAALATPTQTQFGPININTAITQTGAALAAGTITGGAALSLLGSLSAVNHGGIQFTLANAIGSGANQIAITQLDAAVTAGTLAVSDVIPALGTYAQNHIGVDQAAALAEINQLATDGPTRDLALQALVSIGHSSSATARDGGYAGLNAFITANPSYLNTALSQVIDLIDTYFFDAGMRASGQAELVELLTNYGASPTLVTNLIAPKITAAIAFQGGSIVGQNGWLKVMVGLLAAPNTEQNILSALLTRAQNDFAAYPQYPAYTADTIIADIAELFGSDVSRRATTGAEIARLTELLVQLEPNNSGVNDIAWNAVGDMASGLTQRPISEQIALLQAVVDYYAPLGSNASAAQLAIINDVTSRISLLSGSQSLADAAANIANLIQNGSPNAMQLAVSYYNPTAPADFITLVNGIASHLATSQISAITDGIAALAGTPSVGQAGAVRMLLTIGVLAAPDLQKASEATFAHALVANSFNSTDLFAGLSGAIPAVFSRGQVIAFLADVYLAQLATGGSSADLASVKSQVIAEMAVLTQGLGGVSPGSIALAAATDFANVDEALVLGDFIESVLESGAVNATEASTAQSIGAAAATIGGIAAARILVSLAGHRGGNFLLPAGAEIATLVSSGALSASDAGFAIYAGFAVDNVTTLAQSIQLAIGAAANGGSAAAGEAFADLLSHNLTTASALASALSSAVSAHSITALQVVDITAAMSVGSLGVVPSANLLDAILAAALISGQDATVQLGADIRQTGFTAGAFMALVASTAAGTTPAGRASIGVGLAELLAANTITSQQVAAGLDVAVNGDGHGGAPTLSIDAAMAVLAGAAADTSSAAAAASNVTTIGGLIAGLIGNNASYGQSAMTAIANAAPSLEPVVWFDAHATLRSLLAAIADAGSPTALAAVGKGLASLEHAGTLNTQDLFNLPITAVDKKVFVLASALILDSAPEDSEIRRWTASIIGNLIGSNAITASAAYAQIEAAATAQGGSTSDMLAALIKVGQGSVSLGQELFRLLASNTVTWSAVAAAYPGGDNTIVALAAAANAAQAASPSTANAAIQDNVYNYMLSAMPTNWALFIGNGIGIGGATLSGNLGVLLQLAIRGDLSVKRSVGTELANLYIAGTLTPADIQASLTAGAATAPQGAVVYATMLANLHSDAAKTSAILDKIGALETSSNTASIVAAIHAAIAPVNSTVGLSVGDAVTALTGLAVANATPAMLTAIAAEIAGLVNAGRLSAADADYFVAFSSANAPANEQHSRAALLVYLGTALGQDAAALINAIGNTSLGRTDGNIALTSAQAIAIEAMLVDNAAADPYGVNTLYPTLVSTIAASLPPPHWTVQFAAMSHLSNAEKMAFLVQVAESGQGPRAALEAGKAAGAANLPFTLALSGQPVTMTRDQTALFLAGYLMNSPANAFAIGTILVGGYNLGGVSMTFPAATLIAALDSAANGYRVSNSQPILYGPQLSGAELAGILTQIMPAALTRAGGFGDASYYTAIMAEYHTLLDGHYLNASDLKTLLLQQVATGDDRVISAAGQTLAALVKSGTYSSNDIIDPLRTAVSFPVYSLTGVQVAKLAVAIANAMGSDALQEGGSGISANLGSFVGSLATAGSSYMTVTEVIGAIEAINQTPFVGSRSYDELVFANNVAGWLNATQAREFGVEFGKLLSQAGNYQENFRTLGVRILFPDTWASLLIGMVDGVSLGDPFLAALAAHFTTVVGADSQHLSAAALVQHFDQEIRAHTLPVDKAVAELVFMAASDPANLSLAVTNEISALAGMGPPTSTQVLAALANASATSSAPAGTSGIVAAIMDDLRTHNYFTTADIIASLTNGSGQPASNLLLLVQLAATSDPASLLLIGQEIARLELQGLVPAGSAGSAISAAVSANSLSTYTALSLFMRIAHAGETANNVAGVAQTMAYADVVPAAQLIGSLRTAVNGAALTSLEEVTILAGAVSSVSAHQLIGAAVGDELKRLIQTSALTAAQVFARFEAVANAIYPGYYFQQYGYVLAAIANSSDVALQIATGNEIGRLILQGKFTADGSISTTGYPIPTGDPATRYTTWLAIAQTDGAAVQRDVGYNIALGLNTNTLGATDIYPVLEHALQVGAIDASHLAGVLAAIGTQDFNAKLAIPTSANELVTLIQNHVITVADAMAGVDAVASTVPAAAISTWLTIASSSSALANAVPVQIQAFITEGRLTDTTALNAVTNTGSYTSSGTVAKVLIGLASIGDSAMQIGAGAKLAGLIASNFTATNILGLVDTAVAPAHTMPGVNAVKLMLGFLSAMPNGGAGTDAASYVTSHIQSYVTANLLTSADATSALISAAATGPVQIVPFAGSLLVGVSSASAAISAVRAALQAGTLDVHKAVQMLGGIAAGGGTAPAVTEIQAMVTAQQITMAQVIQDFQAAGVTGNLPTAALVSLAATADAAGRAAIASVIADRGTHFGPSSDAFFTGALQQAALDFIDIANGVKTVQQAISDIEQYAPAHHASTDAGLILLRSLLANNNQGPAYFVVNQEISDRLSLGDFGAELAERVAEGTTTSYTNSGTYLPRDPTAISYAAAKALLLSQRDVYGGTITNITKLFNNDVYVAQSNRDFGSFTSNTISNLIYGNSAYYVPGSGGGGYPFDQALMAMARELQNPINGHNGNDLAKVVDKLKVRVLEGISATSLVNAIAQGSLTVDQAIEATEKEVAVITQGASAQDAATIRQMALGWLMLKSSEYMAGNFVMRLDPNAGVGDPIKNPPNKQIKVFLPSDVDNLYYKLVQSYFNDAITGLGGISSIPVNRGITSSFTQASIMAIISSYMESAVRSAGATTVAQAQVAADTVASLYADGYAKVQGPNNAGVFGTITNQVIAKPGDYHSYISLAAQIYATGVPLLGRYVPAFQGLSTQILNAIEAGEFATPLMVANAASMGIVTLMEMSAVSNALGPASNLLAGEFTIIGASAGLFGNIVSGVVHAGVDEVTKAAEDLGNTFKNLANGNNAAASSSAQQMASSLFTLTYGAGFKLEDVAASASDAGRALVDLAKGNPSDVVGDLRSLGKNVVNLLKNNIFVSAISDAVQNYIQTVGSAIASIIPILSDWYNWSYDWFNHIPQQKPSPVAPQASQNILAAAQAALNDRSNFGEFYYGNVVDGYIAGSTVFVDTNGNGVLDAGEYSTTTDANGNYSVPQGVGNIVVVGGVDSSTGLTLTTPLSAPAGSATVTALTTLVQKVQATNNIDTASATQMVASAFGLGSLDLTQLDPVGAVRSGQSGGASLVLATTAALNTLVLLDAAGATVDPTAVLAGRIASAPLGTTIDLTNAATIADLANASGVSANASSAVAQLASASNTLLTNLINSAPDPTTLLNRATAVTIVAQGDTSTALVNAGNDPTLLTNVVTQYTGTNLTTNVQDKLDEVISQPFVPAPYYGPPRWYLDPSVTGVVSTGSASGTSLSGSQSNQEMQTAFHDAAGSPSAATFTPTPDLSGSSTFGLVPSLDNQFRVA